MAKDPHPWRDLAGEIRGLKDALAKIRAASPFANAGFHPTADNGIQSDNFDGNLATGDAGTRGWAMDADQAAFGELILRPGSIGNDALTNPIVPATAHADAGSFSSAVAWSTKCSVTVPVPSGFTKALVLSLVCAATAKNTTASKDFLYTSASIVGMGSLPGWVLGSPDVPAAAYGVATDYQTVLLTGLSGSFTVDGQISTGFATWAADSGNKMNLDISLLFLR